MAETANDAVLPPVQLPASLLRHAKAVAAARDETLAQVVRRALRAYVAAGPQGRQLDLEEAVTSARKRKR
jgi:hypothetical protein